VKAARQQGYTVEVETGKLLADSLNRAVDPEKPYMNTMLRMIATRCMMQAVYFASGSIEEPLFRLFSPFLLPIFIFYIDVLNLDLARVYNLTFGFSYTDPLFSSKVVECTY
jgi:hypothetical protein